MEGRGGGASLTTLYLLSPISSVSLSWEALALSSPANYRTEKIFFSAQCT